MESLGLFLIAASAVAVIPGPDHFYLGAVALRDGRRVALVSAVGMAAGMTVHSVVAATGLGALLLTVPGALIGVRALGALYLLYLGISAIRANPQPDDVAEAPRGRSFVRAMTVNLLNPKIVLFYLAFLPQFVTPSTIPIGVQLLMLGLLFVAIGLVVDVAYAFVGVAANAFLRRRGVGSRALSVASGVAYLALAAFVASTVVLELAGASGPPDAPSAAAPMPTAPWS
ncbi:LysE family translocator [Agromyces silvae]|uniref:LysE family translocator n=1 Tax=Agromyces silvae TaxID=3388266 RepID=UPI00280B2211|nr:LysE family translocator [Agromyces protaetiae]